MLGGVTLPGNKHACMHSSIPGFVYLQSMQRKQNGPAPEVSSFKVLGKGGISLGLKGPIPQDSESTAVCWGQERNPTSSVRRTWGWLCGLLGPSEVKRKPMVGRALSPGMEEGTHSYRPKYGTFPEEGAGEWVPSLNLSVLKHPQD